MGPPFWNSQMLTGYKVTSCSAPDHCRGNISLKMTLTRTPGMEAAADVAT